MKMGDGFPVQLNSLTSSLNQPLQKHQLPKIHNKFLTIGLVNMFSIHFIVELCQTWIDQTCFLRNWTHYVLVLGARRTWNAHINLTSHESGRANQKQYCSPASHLQYCVFGFRTVVGLITLILSLSVMNYSVMVTSLSTPWPPWNPHPHKKKKKFSVDETACFFLIPIMPIQKLW